MTFKEKLQTNYYSKIDEKYPNKEDYRKVVCEKCNTVEFDKEGYRRQLLKYKYEEDAKYFEFKKDLFNDLDITDNPKNEKLFSIAWDYGHSSGFSEVYFYANELVDLII